MNLWFRCNESVRRWRPWDTGSCWLWRQIAAPLHCPSQSGSYHRWVLGSLWPRSNFKRIYYPPLLFEELFSSPLEQHLRIMCSSLSDILVLVHHPTLWVKNGKIIIKLIKSPVQERCSLLDMRSTNPPHKLPIVWYPKMELCRTPFAYTCLRLSWCMTLPSRKIMQSLWIFPSWWTAKYVSLPNITFA